MIISRKKFDEAIMKAVDEERDKEREHKYQNERLDELWAAIYRTRSNLRDIQEQLYFIEKKLGVHPDDWKHNLEESVDANKPEEFTAMNKPE